MQTITYELKYCERCGSLGLRRTQSADNYCAPCAQILVSYSTPQNLLRRPLIRKQNAHPIPLQLCGAAEGALTLGRLQ